MKTRSMFGILAAVILVASFVIPSNLATPSAVQADPGICKWDIVFGPNHLPLSTDISSPIRHDGMVALAVAAGMPAGGGWGGYKGREIDKFVTAGDGRTALAVITGVPFDNAVVGLAGGLALAGVANPGLLMSPLQLGVTTSIAIAFSPYPYAHLANAMVTREGYTTYAPAGIVSLVHGNVWNVAVAPDDPKFWAVVTSGPTFTGALNQDAPIEVWITTNAGTSWERTQFITAWNAVNGANNGFISAIDISPNYGGKRDIAVGIRNAANAANTGQIEIWTLQSTGFTGWRQMRLDPMGAVQLPSVLTGNIGRADVLALKFSPTYVGDASLAVVFSTDANSIPASATFFDIMLRDLDQNRLLSWVGSIEVKDPLTIPGSSPDIANIVSADLELPSDFSGQSPSLRRAYVSLDANGLTDNSTAIGGGNGIFRIDDTYVYELMDTSGQGTFGRRIASIAYFGTYASGKLLAGEVRGDCCTATVPTWFTDSPTTCPIPCWYPALKPPTGAAGMNNEICNCTVKGFGNAQVAWRADGTLAYAATGYYNIHNFLGGGATWWHAIHPWYTRGTAFEVPRYFDESALSISRNNGETWNQTWYIDTNLNFNFIPPATAASTRTWDSWLNDLAIAPDCTTLYLASASSNLTDCISFDSVWRTSINPAVTAPLPVIPPLGFWYERVLTRVTALTCADANSELPLLRLAPDKEDGELVGWAAQGTRAQMWSPDFGDFWANITPRHNVQDFAFESSTLLWNLRNDGIVQKLPYTGTAWSSAEADMDSLLFQAHMIAVKPEGKLLVGAGAVTGSGLYPVAYSMNAGQNWSVVRDPMPTPGQVHVAFDTKFDDNNTIFVANDGNAVTSVANGSVYRYQLPWPAGGRWIDNDMLATTNGNCITTALPTAPFAARFFGLQRAFTGDALYAAYTSSATVATTDNGTVLRTLTPLAGIPKPGVWWDILNTFVQYPDWRTVQFTLEPWSLKICGCLTMNTDSILYAIDNNRYRTGVRTGLIWAFTDCMAKKGPTLITADGTLIGCDPVSGRAQEVNLCWEQLCVADRYDLEIAKDKDFTIRVVDWVLRCDTAGFIEPVELLTPCVYFPAGGNTAQAASSIGVTGAGLGFGNLECGHKYFWRVQVRRCATTQLIHSPWSEVRSFTIKAGLPVRADYYGLKLLAPDNGCVGCPVKPASFSWSPFKETTKYKFVLAKDAAMTQVVAEAEVPTTAYEYNGTLDYSTNYFWRVMSLEPAPSDWSATFSFQTEAAPAPPAAPEAAPPTPLWVWVVIAIGAILVIVTLVLIFKTRRV